jgi:putative flavoprotein involved in K+ transport
VADHVVVATGANLTPRIPPFADQLDPAITRLHSAGYRNPAQLRGGATLVVGAGNSGAELALELAAARRVWLAGRDPGHVPLTLGCSAYRLMGRLTLDTRLGRWVAAKRSGGGDPVVRVRPRDLARAGVRRAPRVVGVRGGRPALEDGRVLDVANVVWCTGFVRDYSWIRLPVFDAGGEPVHRRGVVGTEPGMYFVGLRLQSSVISDLVGGVGADAEFVVEQIAARAGAVGYE